MDELALFEGTDDVLRELALFAGAGGGILGGHLLGWRTICAVEWEPYPAAVLAQRQNDGILPPFPIWDDVRTFNGFPWRGIVDVVSGGFPCQDISAAGKGAGLDGARSGLWSEMARIIGEVRPRYAFVENSPVLTSRGLGTVLGDLAALGYDCRWGVVSAADAGAPHLRERIWILAERQDARNAGVVGFEGDGADVGRGWEAVGVGSGGYAGREAVADADRGRELQPQGSLGEVRGRSGDCGENVADARISEGQQRYDADQERRRSGQAEQAGVGGCGSWWAIDPADLPDADSIRRDHKRVFKGISGESVRRPIRFIDQNHRRGSYKNGRPAQSRVGRTSDGLASELD